MYSTLIMAAKDTVHSAGNTSGTPRCSTCRALRQRSSRFAVCSLSVVLLCAVGILLAPATAVSSGFLPGERVLFEAHNAYPYHGLWRNRIDNALGTGFPVAVELDLKWYEDETGDEYKLVLAHHEPLTGREPTLENYFFERVRPYVEAALEADDTTDWPLITLNINDIRTSRPEAFAEIWRLAETYKEWLCSAEKTAATEEPAPITLRPILVLSNGGRLATRHFYDAVPEGESLRIFGAGSPDADADNFRRWINYSWTRVEPEGQPNATPWDDEKADRLQALVRNAHERGYWIRFYALNGHGPVAVARLGLNPHYNFGSLEAVKVRWEAAYKAGADFIATDQIIEAREFEREITADR